MRNLDAAIGEEAFTYVLDKNLTANQRTNADLLIKSDADFVLHSITGGRTGSFELTVNETGTGKAWQSAFVRDTNFMGTAQNPNFLYHPRYIKKGTTLRIELLDLSGSGNTLQLLFSGKNVFGSGLPSEAYKSGWFQYATGRQALSGNGSAVYPIKIDTDADFVVQKIVAEKTSTFSLQITQASGGKLWESKPANDVNRCGTAQRPFLLIPNRLVPAGETLLLAVQDTSGSSNTIDIVLEGYKVFR